MVKEILESLEKEVKNETMLKFKMTPQTLKDADFAEDSEGCYVGLEEDYTVCPNEMNRWLDVVKVEDLPLSKQKGIIDGMDLYCEEFDDAYNSSWGILK